MIHRLDFVHNLSTITHEYINSFSNFYIFAQTEFNNYMKLFGETFLT